MPTFTVHTFCHDSIRNFINFSDEVSNGQCSLEVTPTQFPSQGGLQLPFLVYQMNILIFNRT